MKLFIFAHRFEVGGSQVNAIDLAVALRDHHGFDVVIFAAPGPMVDVAESKGLRFLPAPDAKIHPSVAVMRALRSAVRKERPDLIHVWDWPQCLDAYYAVHLASGIPMIVSHMSMDIDRLLPKSLPTTFGTPEFVDKARAMGRRKVELLVPPVDVQLNFPGAVSPSAFRQRYGIGEDDVTIVTVSRVVKWMKGESLRRTIEAVRMLGRNLPMRLLIVGDGDARADIEARAAQVNDELGRNAVVLTGAMLDPREAYAAADIFVGMGGSALRAMAFEKPVIVTGERGFAKPFNPSTADDFFYKGIYGVGDGSLDGSAFAEDLRMLAESRNEWEALGKFSRDFVVGHFGLESVASGFADLCRATVAEGTRLSVAAADGLRTAAFILAGQVLPKRIRTALRTVFCG